MACASLSITTSRALSSSCSHRLSSLGSSAKARFNCIITSCFVWRSKASMISEHGINRQVNPTLQSGDGPCGHCVGVIGPVDWNQPARLIGEQQQKVRSASAQLPPDDLEALTLKWVANSCDDGRFRNVLERGSLSWFRSYFPLMFRSVLAVRVRTSSG